MRPKLLSSIIVSASLIAAAPAAAAPSSASKLSVVGARAGAPAGNSRLAEGSGGIIALVLVAGIAAIAIVGALADDSNNNNPASP
ncbi:MAG TPA: hypothetical protein VE567_06205 [Sphingomonas sp.]|nr:hypothetical protein [Sphingomonas sp.]